MSELVSKSSRREVSDERGNIYKLKSSIGEGGQGIVCATDHENTLIKICRRPKSERQSWMEHIRWLMQQDLDSLNIARPVARIVKPQPGYVMELMDGLYSLQSLMEATEQALCDQNIQAYLDQGGIRRRLHLLAKLARTLAELHSRGMAFGDLSPANVFISEDPKYCEVWLIDCDNISLNQRMSNDIYTGSPRSVYTPFYGAPEIIRGDSMISSLSDSWSFAVVAFRLLTAIHPLVGDLVSDGDPELEEKALEGELPWIDHPTDARNRASHGLPRDLVLIKPLKDLFERCFNAGLDRPEMRPSLSEWAEKFEHACEWVVDCVHCNGSFFYKPVKGKLSCGFCDAQPEPGSLLFLRHYLWDKRILDIEGAKASDCFIDTGLRQILNCDNFLIVKRSPPGSSFHINSEPLFKIELEEQGVEVSPMGSQIIHIKVGGSTIKEFSTSFRLEAGERKGKTVVVLAGGDTDQKDACIFKW